MNNNLWRYEQVVCIYSISKVVTNHRWLRTKNTSFSHHFTTFVSLRITIKVAFFDVRLHRTIFILGKMFCDHRSKVKPNRQCITILRYWWRRQEPTFVCKTLPVQIRNSRTLVTSNIHNFNDRNGNLSVSVCVSLKSKLWQIETIRNCNFCFMLMNLVDCVS